HIKSSLVICIRVHLNVLLLVVVSFKRQKRKKEKKKKRKKKEVFEPEITFGIILKFDSKLFYC
ncbi:MAG: hypothetical protein J8272_02050, partial ['Prunus persica' phytoplasma PP2]|nr:hypothetical protein ['Prunus persica' phytoplasma PP2]